MPLIIWTKKDLHKSGFFELFRLQEQIQNIIKVILNLTNGSPVNGNIIENFLKDVLSDGRTETRCFPTLIRLSPLLTAQASVVYTQPAEWIKKSESPGSSTSFIFN